MRHGEAAAINTKALEMDLQNIREALQFYLNEDIYNIDEIGLYWKATSDRTLASEKIAGGKKKKARITANFCCNVTRFDKLPIWFI